MLTKNLKEILDDKLWATAKVLIKHYTKRGYKITQFHSIDTTYSYKLHLIIKKGYETIGIEIRERCSINSFFEKFILGCQSNKIPIKLYFAVPEKIGDDETIIAHGVHADLKNIGVGLLIIEGNNIIEDVTTISCHRRFALEPGTSLGKHKNRISEIVEEYNSGDCLTAIRNLADEVEDATYDLAAKAAKKGKINITAADIEANRYDWEGIINCLSAPNYGGQPQTKYFDTKLSNSMKSFKDVRNLSGHKKGAKERKQLEQQYLEAMLQGTRLLRTLISIQAKVR